MNTPTTDDVRYAYLAFETSEHDLRTRQERAEEFDRWLAAHDSHLRLAWNDQQRREQSMFGDDFPEWT